MNTTQPITIRVWIKIAMIATTTREPIVMNNYMKNQNDSILLTLYYTMLHTKEDIHQYTSQSKDK